MPDSQNIKIPSGRSVIHHYPNFTHEEQKQRKQEEILLAILKVYQTAPVPVNQSKNGKD